MRAGDSNFNGLDEETEMARIRSEEDAKDYVSHDVHKTVDIDWRIKCFVEFMIVLNAVQLGACVQAATNTLLTRSCPISENIFLVVFVIEVSARIYLLGWRYFRYKWNILDCTLTLAAVIDFWILTPILNATSVPIGDFYVMRLLRLARILRILKVLRSKKELQMLMEGLMGALASMFWVATLLAFLIYTTSIICVTLYQDIDWNEAIVESKLTFESMPKAMFALFSLSIVADWTPIVMPVINQHPEAVFIFVIFIVMSTFGILNLIIGVITERTATVQMEYSLKEQHCKDLFRMKNIEEIAKIIFATQEDATITYEEMKELMEDGKHGPRIKALTEGVNLPDGFNLEDCHAMFDKDATNNINHEEFVQGMKRLIFSNDFQRSCMTQASIADVLFEVKRAEERIKDQLKELLAVFHGGMKVDSADDPGGRGPGGGTLFVPPPLLTQNTAIKAYQEKAKDVQDSGDQDLVACRQLADRLREPLAQFLISEGIRPEASQGSGSLAAAASGAGRQVVEKESAPSKLRRAVSNTLEATTLGSVSAAAANDVGRNGLDAPTQPKRQQHTGSTEAAAAPAQWCTDHLPVRAASSQGLPVDQIAARSALPWRLQPHQIEALERSATDLSAEDLVKAVHQMYADSMGVPSGPVQAEGFRPPPEQQASAAQYRAAGEHLARAAGEQSQYQAEEKSKTPSDRSPRMRYNPPFQAANSMQQPAARSDSRASASSTGRSPRPGNATPRLRSCSTSSRGENRNRSTVSDNSFAV